ncbi:MAG: Uma2 family endonuclease [Gammaproteobacteria bacterium]|nr:Uma2 family endonuclease [Gammaproteobacteria bacterium]MCP5197741.1 Uma2 family endonuclease [Gammaproteobacteria bacterium]
MGSITTPDIPLEQESLQNTSDSAVPQRYRLTVTDYHRLAEVGVFDENSRVELIEGDLIAMPPIGERHASYTRRLNQFFSRRVGDTAIVDVQNPVMLNAHSEPQPDIVLLKPCTDFYESVHPGPADVLLLIEVSDTTLRYDRETKVPLYAKAGVPEVWVVDTLHQRLEVYRCPSADGYREVRYPALEEMIAPVLLPDLMVSVADVLTGLPLAVWRREGTAI